MSDPPLFKWRHFEADIILCAVQRYLRYALNYRNVAYRRRHLCYTKRNVVTCRSLSSAMR
jgi:transposase-like protein